MKLPIENVKVDDESRIRKDPGDIAPLENSIRKVGLLNPILVDENNQLVAGYRRLTACRKLGWREVEVTVVRFEGDLLKILEAEVDENLLRKDFTGEEIESIERRREEILRKLRGNIWQRFWRWLKKIFRPGSGKRGQDKEQDRDNGQQEESGQQAVTD
ncbi:MAG: ParB N-terminal domain-containing protein [Candidatus Erginobacter occultus]|nr:ParB N-terminal domain-containing protein [Candidatus Erginobacter occultus]